jgi:hypothetical protein
VNPSEPAISRTRIAGFVALLLAIVVGALVLATVLSGGARPAPPEATEPGATGPAGSITAESPSPVPVPSFSSPDNPGPKASIEIPPPID